MGTLVQVNNITKVFPGVKALDNVTFDIQEGEVHVLLGENGAGKSTLMKILSGVYQPTSGEIVLGGKVYSKLTPDESYENGISIIYQELSLIDELSVMENLFVGKLPTKKKLGLNTVDYKLMLEKTKNAMEILGLDIDPNEIVENLTISEKQQCEIAKAIVADAKVIIMDEPTTSLTLSDTAKLFEIVRNLKSRGKGIVYISHKMEEIKQIGDRVTVLKDGQTVGTRDVEGTSIDELIKMMVGREVKGNHYRETPVDYATAPVVFETKGITRKNKPYVKDQGFKVYDGEILGFFGLVGSGRSEMMNAIFGSEPKTAGQVFINGQEVKIKTPYDAIKNGLAMVTENRRETGFIKTFDIKSNISLVPFIKTSKAGGLLGLLDYKKEKEWALDQKEKMRIKCSSIDEDITELSGGNQQKVILGKWMAAESKVVIFDEPTKGIDVGSKSEIYILMRKLAESGHGIVMISSDMAELLSVCDRICVFKEGHIQAEMLRSEATQEKIMKIATGE